MNRLRSRAPRGDRDLRVERDPDILRSHLEDAGHFGGGRAAALLAPTTEAQIAEAFRTFASLLPVGAQSSLTGGATPNGLGAPLHLRLNRIVDVGVKSARVQAGVTLADLDSVLASAGRYYPPAPTFTGAFLGGTVATNAAGAATFKYGTTRSWVEALTVVLPSGDVLEIERGRTCADEGTFELELGAGTTRVVVPTSTMPAVQKLSAGYFAAPRMDLIDLFIGSEGTLGVITEITLRIRPERPAFCLALVPFMSRTVALDLVRRLRERAIRTWADADRHGLDVCAIEHLDKRCLAIAREDGLDRISGIRWPANAEMALLITIELPSQTSREQAFDEIGRAAGGVSNGPLGQFCRMLQDCGVMDDVEIAVPGDNARAAQLLGFREAIPASVNARVGRAQREVDPRIRKTAADMIVPFDRFADMLDVYEAEFERRGLVSATWGHISDGNVHPNVIPRSYADVESGNEAILRFGEEAIRMGGAPLAEHGVGRHPLKQRLLRMLYGDAGIEQMRAVKRAIDPELKLAPGVLFDF